MGVPWFRLQFALWIALTAQLAQAQLLRERDIPEPVFPVMREGGVFLEPNELRPQDAIPLLQESTAGAYVSIGSERSFIHASLSNASRLIALDKDPVIVRFNRVNAALLAAAKDRESYVHLRLEASFEEWKKAAQGLLYKDPMRDLLTSDTIWKWWNQRVRHVNGSGHKNEFGGFIAKPAAGSNFDGANYLWEDKLFAKLHAMAKARRIESHLLDLRGRDRVRELVQAIRNGTDPETPLSVLDISNVWDSNHFLSDAQTAALLREFKEVATPKSLMLASKIMERKEGIENWKYLARTFEVIDPANPNVDRWFIYSSPTAALKHCKEFLLKQALKAAQKTIFKPPGSSSQ